MSRKIAAELQEQAGFQVQCHNGSLAMIVDAEHLQALLDERERSRVAVSSLIPYFQRERARYRRRFRKTERALVRLANGGDEGGNHDGA